MTPKEKMEMEQSIAREIGYYFFEKNNTGTLVEQVEKTTNQIQDLHIARIEFDGKIITITTSRPGLLIGLRGETINGLEKRLHKSFENFERVEVLEERVIGSLFSFQYALGLDDDSIN